MKKYLPLFLAAALLTGCGNSAVQPRETVIPETAAAPATEMLSEETEKTPASRFDSITNIVLSDSGITVTGNEAAVFASHDILYYEDKDVYESGNPYGEGEDHEKHSLDEAAAHTVVNISQPGAYEVSGNLSAGQIRVDLGEEAYEDPDAVVELTLRDADITCTVAPAILFLNTYECDGNWSADKAKPEVDTSSAGVNLILEGKNTVSGSHVAKIFKDKEGEKKLWKQDGAIYSYMSMNVYGPGALKLTADKEGLDTELHLTINGGNITIHSDNDGINTNEDGVSVTTINGGSLHIAAGLGAEGDGIDSNGYLVINGGTVVASANPAADAGLDSDLGSFIHGGTVIALGSAMDWAESDSRQVTMNLQFSGYQSGSSAILITDERESPVFAYDPDQDEYLDGNIRQYVGAVISCPGLTQGGTYHVYLDSTLTGEETGGIYRSVSHSENSVQMQYSGTDLGRGGFGGRGPGGMENLVPPEGFDRKPPEGMDPDQRPKGDFGGPPSAGMGNMAPPEGFEGGMPELPEGETFPEGEMPRIPERGFGGPGEAGQVQSSTAFYMNDKVNAFSGVGPVAE